MTIKTIDGISIDTKNFNISFLMGPEAEFDYVQEESEFIHWAKKATGYWDVDIEDRGTFYSISMPSKETSIKVHELLKESMNSPVTFNNITYDLNNFIPIIVEKIVDYSSEEKNMYAVKGLTTHGAIYNSSNTLEKAMEFHKFCVDQMNKSQEDS